jgi:hypothetical protein
MGRIIPYSMENKKCSKPPTRMDWFKGKSSPETINFAMKIMGLSGLIFSLKPIHKSQLEGAFFVMIELVPKILQYKYIYII